ncbi:T9SS type A sorting domain-containing protein [Hymenobacter sp. PAMC 26628]|uniref:T9SS type A sorting domain-containing protein n=1 Tax=Hymenobacter sp. PAMC 26628 TaxID=1484118 RepID=UPI001F235025|nr:T9SS type A sorting domain-containing protein [Hymenobacter sp. PAMC 26628]
MLFNLHGYASNGPFQEYYGDFRPIADTANFIIVHPNGTRDTGGERFWNTWVPPGNGINDVQFITDLLVSLQSQFAIDPDRIYSTGLSNGGFMSYELACQLSDRIAAIASVAGSVLPSRLNACTPLHPVPILEIHGTEDYIVPYYSTWYASIPSLLDYWVRFNGCSSTSTITEVPNINTTDGCTAIHYVYSGGRASSVVEHYKIVGGGHSWPGAPIDNNAVTNRDFNASQAIWRFLRRYRLNQLKTALSTTTNAVLTLDFSASPNPVKDVLTIRSSKTFRTTQLSVTDILGRIIAVQTIPMPDGSLQLLTSNWCSGTYTLRINDNGTASYRRVVKL